MAKGNWRNWDEVQCVKCGARIYRKYAKKYKGEFYCPLCFEKIGELKISKEEMGTILTMYEAVYTHGLITDSMTDLVERIKKENGEPIHKQTENEWLEENAGVGEAL